MLDSISFFRVIKNGFVGFSRNLWLSAAATMVMTTTLVIFATLFLLFALTSYSIKTVQDTVDISVYFKTGLSEKQALSIKQELESNPKVREITYRSAEQALEDFKRKHAGDPLITQSLNELTENPLPATLNVKAHQLEDYPEIARQVQDDRYREFITKVNFEDNRVIIERLSRILRFIVVFGLGLVVVFAVIAILVIFNTITLTIYNRREEVEIMRLVGATNWYIRGPFLIEAVLYSLCSTVIAALLFRPVFDRLLPRVALYVSPEITFLSRNIFDYWYLVAMLGVAALLLSMFTTALAMRRYLKI